LTVLYVLYLALTVLYVAKEADSGRGTAQVPPPPGQNLAVTVLYVPCSGLDCLMCALVLALTVVYKTVKARFI